MEYSITNVEPTVIRINSSYDDPYADWHACPFAEEIYNNNNPQYCNCSPEQTRRCAEDI